MERKKYIVALTGCIFLASSVFASYNTEIYSAYISNQMDKWKMVIDNMQEQTKEKALELFEQDTTKIQKNWNYLNLITQLARSQDKIGNYQKAKEYYEKILNTESRFLWVKNELYPELIKKMKSE